MTRIGPSFSSELAEAGLLGLPFSWGETGINAGSLSDADRKRVEAVLAKHDPDRAAPEPVPASIPIWQFAWQAAAEGLIPMKEARAWSGRGVLPATLESKLPQVVPDLNEREGLAMRLESLTEVQRDDPLLPTLGALFGKDGPALDTFFREASKRGASA